MRDLNLRVGGKYRMKRKIGIEINSSEEVAIKLEKKTIDPSMLQSEVSIYRSLSGGAGIPRVLWHDSEGEYRVLVLGLLGPSLEDLFHFCDCRFSLKTVLMLADQLICRLRFMHRKHISHRDIKPHNFLMGVGSHGNQVYVADMGLAVKYDPKKTNIPSTHDSRRSMVGTPYYAAINNNFGFGQTQADDLEALGYTLICFLRGSLPWHDFE